MTRTQPGLGRPAVVYKPAPLGPIGGRATVTERWSWTLPRRERVPEFDRPTVPPPVGSRGGDPADIVIAIDVSGSTRVTDPQAHSFVAARRIVNLLVDGIGGPTLEDRIGVVLFADRAVPWLPLTTISTRAGRKRIHRVLRRTNDGGTAIVPAIKRARSILRSTPGRKKVALLFTDGETNETTGQLTKAVESLPPGSLHVVVLGGQLPEQWQRVPVGSITTIDSMTTTPDSLEWLLARALYRSLDLSWPT